MRMSGVSQFRAREGVLTIPAAADDPEDAARLRRRGALVKLDFEILVNEERRVERPRKGESNGSSSSRVADQYRLSPISIFSKCR
jgi:hypothetical protein